MAPSPQLVFVKQYARSRADPRTTLCSGSLRDGHEAACAWFIGPKAENADYLRMYVEIILNDLVQCRRNFSQDDEVRISSPSSRHGGMIVIFTI